MQLKYLNSAFGAVYSAGSRVMQLRSIGLLPFILDGEFRPLCVLDPREKAKILFINYIKQ